MDTCIKSKVAVVTTGLRIALGSILLIVMQIALIAPLFAATFPNRDYLLSTESRGGFIDTASSTHSVSAGSQVQSTILDYVAFDGTSYTMNAYPGRFVVVLVPSEAPQGVAFTEDHIEEMVDRLDVLYATFVEMVGDEPAGPGLLNVAFVTESCGSGCGYVGHKGIEITHNSDNYHEIVRNLEVGNLDNLLIHELAHNFDLYSNYLYYLPDHAHAWTDVFEFFTPYRFGREGSDLQRADDLYQSPQSSVWKPYLEDPAASWENCVRDQLCHDLGFTENNLWAMIYYRIEALHGTAAVLNSFDFLNDYTQTHAPPLTDQAKEDLRLLALAVGADTNISCYLETLKWVVSSSLRNELQSRFGNGGAFCADVDQDGYSLVEGDCDDQNPALSPGQAEIESNGVDDDCDGIRDEETLFDLNGADLPPYSSSLMEHSLPIEIEGLLTSLQDRDGLRFALPPNGRVEVKFCAKKGFSGWVTALQPNGQNLQSDFWYEYLAVTGCSKKVFDFGSLSTGNFEMQADLNPGQYTLSVSAAEDLQQDYSPLFSVVPRAGGGMNVMISDTNGMLSEMGADELEIWISGEAIRLTAPYSSQMQFSLSGNTVAALNSGNLYQARFRPRKNGLPLSGLSAGHLFRFQATPQTQMNLDDTYSGVWFDESHSGEGFVVEVHENDQALVYWFTYTPNGEQRWMLGLGEVQGNTISVVELLKTRGGRFGAQFDPDEVTFSHSGSLSITFLDCDTAVANYSVDRIGDHQSLQRLSNVQGHACGEPSQPLTSDISGSWYDPSHSGEGFIVQQLSNEQALVFWFSYDSSGEQAWMINSGSVDNGHITIDSLLQPVGGHFGRSFNPSAVNQLPWGNLEMELECVGGTAAYDASREQFSNGSQQLVPLTRLQNSVCEY